MLGYINQNGEKIAIEAQIGELLIDIAKKHSVKIDAPCGKNGKCGKCKIKASGNLSEISKEERAFLSDEEIENGIRLACFAKILGEFEIYPQNIAKMKISTKGLLASFEASPLSNMPFGVAIDIGTTTVALYLCDLFEGKIIDTYACANGQKIYGADVISRCKSIADDNNALVAQQNIIISQINEGISILCEKNSVKSADIGALSICGNTIIEHLFAGIDPTSISVYPFTSPSHFGEFLDMAKLFNISPNAKIYLAPCIDSYVGGDIVAGLSAVRILDEEKPCLFIDIGTNGEIALGNKDNLVCCATAAGPAFEGAHIEKGMSSIDGAINKISIENKKVVFSTIGDTFAKGICGSGIIDAVAVMLDLGILDETGAIADIDEVDDEIKEYVGEINGQNAFIIDKESNVYITQKDIREIQLAKSAIAAGINTLMHISNISANDVEKVILSKKSALRISLLPKEFEDKITVGGNTAGMGAVAFLTSEQALDYGKKIKLLAQYTELSESAFFMDNYVEMMYFE